VTRLTRDGTTREPFGRIDKDEDLRARLQPLCRLRHSEIWEDPLHGHRVGVLDATKLEDVRLVVSDMQVRSVISDPPYNVRVGNTNTRDLFKLSLPQYLDFCRKWVANTLDVMATDAHFYVWLGADYKDNFQPLPDFMILMRQFPELTPRNFITLRNQRGYGTQKNWMWVRQELLYYVKGNPSFGIEAEYTDIPKILRGYYKKVKGRMTENLERSKSENIRAGNVWVDIQQVFYRVEENVPGCYAQKPLKAIERIVAASTGEGAVILDCFAHSGTTLLAGERMGRRVVTFDIDPIFAELTIRRLEHFRRTGKTGWQWRNPFPETEVAHDTTTVA
jgi:site-specific DNA-methyltransferase (adenine-specific)